MQRSATAWRAQREGDFRLDRILAKLSARGAKKENVYLFKQQQQQQQQQQQYFAPAAAAAVGLLLWREFQHGENEEECV